MSHNYPIRLHACLTDSPAQVVQMPYYPSLANTVPLMLTPPYAPAIYFEDNSYIVFGEGEIGPPPGIVQYEKLEEEELHHEPESKETPHERYYDAVNTEEDRMIRKKQSYEAVYEQGYDQGWKRSWHHGFAVGYEQGYQKGYCYNKHVCQCRRGEPEAAAEAEEMEASSTSSTSLGSLCQEPPSSTLFCRDATSLALIQCQLVGEQSQSLLQPQSFLCEDQLNHVNDEEGVEEEGVEEEEEEEEEAHTDTPKRRYNNWQSNIRTVFDPMLSEEEQQERNKEACRLNFGDWGKGKKGRVVGDTEREELPLL